MDCTTVDGRSSANQLRLVVYLIIYKGFSTIAGGYSRRISEHESIVFFVILWIGSTPQDARIPGQMKI